MASQKPSVDSANPVALFSAEYAIRFQDVDAAQTLFFPRLFDYLSDTYLAALSAWRLPVTEALRTKAWISPLVHAEADFTFPLRFGDTFRIDIYSVEAKTSSLKTSYRVVRTAAESTIAATAQLVHVFIDPKSGSTLPVPDALRSVGAQPSR